MSDMNQIVTVVNRTSKPLHATWNGRPYDIPAYPAKISLPKIVALAARFQNPVMGRGTPMEDWNIRSEYLVGIAEDGDPIDPIEQTDALQRWDVESLNGRNTEVIRPRGASIEVRQPQSTIRDTGGFVKP